MPLVNRIIQPIVTKTGLIAAGASITIDVPIPTNTTCRLTADVLLVGHAGGALDLCAGLPAEAVYKNASGVVSLVTAGAGSKNPQNSNDLLAARAIASELNAGGGAISFIAFTVSGTNARLTVTNESATEDADYDVVIWAHHIAYQFSPADLPALQAWYRADLGVTLGVGSGVQGWADQSGKGDAGRNLAQLVGANQPTYNPGDAAYNNQDTISFNAAAVQYFTSGAWAAPPGQPLSIFIVGQASNAGTEIWLDDTSGLVLETDNLGHYLFAGAFLQKLTPPAGTPEFFGALADGVTSKLYLNAQTPVATGAAGADGITSPMSIGSNFGAAPLNGKIAEIVITSAALSAGDLAALAAYFSARYGIVIGP